jgi:TATA-box binding protein (TBP) (component of TFIID and TFIIIB)
MGMTEELDESKIPFKINDLQMQSATMVIDLGYKINLIKLSKTLPRHYFMYEPELFPALRLILFNPMCVNVFSTGKVVVLGLKKLTNQNALSQQIRSLLGVYIDRDSC